MEDMIKDKEGKEIRIGSIVKMKGEDIEDGIVIGFDDGMVDVIELGDGFTIDTDSVEVVSELNGQNLKDYGKSKPEAKRDR